MTSPDNDYDTYLDSVLIGGREPASIIIANYDATWPEQFADVQRRVAQALAATALSVEHIGSTSVPGLAAKPIIDVLLTVRSVEDEAAYVDALEQVGFVLRVREPGHRMFRTSERRVHLHVYASEDEAVTDYLDLRNWLRESASDRALYEATKRDLAQREWSDMNHYAAAKSDVVRAILARARARGVATSATEADERSGRGARVSGYQSGGAPALHSTLSEPLHLPLKVTPDGTGV